MKSTFTTGVAIIVMILTLCTGCSRKPAVFETEMTVLGTFAQVSIAGLTPDESQEATRKAEQALKSLDHIGYTFGAGGELQRVNDALANGRTIAVSEEMIDLLRKATALSLASGGIFNPAAGELTALWEFHCTQPDCSESTYPEEVQKLVEQKVAAVLERKPTMDDLIFRGKRVSSRNRQVRLEFGDVIRGLALDKGIESLRQAGAVNAMIDIGGSVHTTGTRGDHAWWIGIPDASGEHMIGSIETASDESVFTVRALNTSLGQQQDTIYRRVVDPRNGLPPREVRSVTVIHTSAMVANAAATAYLISGTRDWKTVADQLGVGAVVMITRDGTIYTSPAIEHRIHWKQGISHQHLVP